MHPSKFAQRLLLALFFFSGFAALLYQVVWQRMLVFYTGSDTVSISLIVTAFMSGLGLGYLAGGPLADASSARRNLQWFVVAEVGILLFALASRTVLYEWLYQADPQPQGRPLVLYALVFGVLLVPTFLMGLSLPVLSKAFKQEVLSEQARYIGRLYAINTLGAEAGALLTGVVLVRTLGYEHAIHVGAVLNGLCAAGALYLGMRMPAADTGQASARSSIAPRPLRITPALASWSAQYALSGFAALSLELIWFRTLETLIKSVSLTFSILLAIYLGSMAVGTAVGQRWGARLQGAARERLFLRAQVLLYVWTGLSFVMLLAAISGLPALDHLWDYFRSYEPDMRARIVLPTYVIIPLLLMFVPTFLMGLSFSLSQLMLQDHHEEVGRKVGWLQFINIVGSALGAWWVTWVGFPALGTATLIKGVTGLGLLYAALLLWRRHQGALATTGMATMVAGVAFLVPGNEAFWRTINGILEPERFLYAENESGLSIIKQLEMEDDLRGVVFANGLGQSSMPYRTGGVHTVLGVLPVLLHPRPERVAVIGLGSGATLFGAAARPETRELVCFEIMSNQASVLRRYAEREADRAVLRILDDPRLRLILHDGRYRLNVMPERYDLIEADALRPNSAFSGNIYSREYFQLVRSRLHPGGMAATWSPTPRVHATFCSVFPHVVGVDGFVLLGSNEPIALDTAAIRQRMAEPFTHQLFLDARIDLPATVEPYLARLRHMDVVSEAQGEWNTDLFPRDEYSLPYSWALVRSKLFGSGGSAN